jgi:hypothetical protein
MAQFDLNRSNDTPIATLKLNEITPVNWHRFPSPLTGTMLTDANPNEAKPRYTAAAQATDWAGGARGDDVDTSTAAVALANSSGAANEANYAPRTQAAKLAVGNLTPGTVLATDVARARGWIEPGQRYPVAGDPALAAPVVTSIAPNTAAAGSNPVWVVITGTGFTPWSTVITGGGAGSFWDKDAKYISPTQMAITVDPRSSVAGTASVAVKDHNVLSNTNVVFTFT